MAHRLNVVPIWTDDKRGKVVRVVLRSQARRTVVFSAGGKRCTVESFNLLPALRLEGKMEMGGPRLALSPDAQRRSFIRPTELYAKRAFRDHGYTERFKCLEVEGLARFVVADAENDVVKHELAAVETLARPNVRAERMAAAGRLGGLLQHTHCAAGRPGGLPWTVRSRARC